MRLTVRGEYPANWTEIATATKAAAGWRCVRCGHPHGDRIIGGLKSFHPCDAQCTHTRDDRIRCLTVHHLDGDKTNSLWWNLLALCQVCHLKVQARLIPERQWLWEHTPWFVPYACGFYALYYGGMAITRAQADADPQRWLAMGQPWLRAAYAGAALASVARPGTDPHR